MPEEPTFETTWEQYVAAWKAEEAPAKLAMLQRALTADCAYTDPLVALTGPDALVHYMLDFHRQIPGGHFVTEWFQAHHGVSAATWTLRDGAGTVLDRGVSYARYDEQGQLVAMTGFFDTPTEPEA